MEVRGRSSLGKRNRAQLYYVYRGKGMKKEAKGTGAGKKEEKRGDS